MASANTVRCGCSAGGDSAASTKNTAAARPATAYRLAGVTGFFTGEAAGAAAGTAGAADTWTGGGGQVSSPSRTTVMDRCTVSSKSSTSWPSLPGVISFIRLTRLVPYI